MRFSRLVSYYTPRDLVRSLGRNESIGQYLPSSVYQEFRGCRHALFAYLTELRKTSNAGKVITPAWGCEILSHVILKAGFSPLLVDVTPHTLQMDVEHVCEAVAIGDVAAVILVAENGMYYKKEDVSKVRGTGAKVVLDYALAWQSGVSRLPHNGDVEIYSGGFSKPVSGLNFGALVGQEVLTPSRGEYGEELVESIKLFAHMALQNPHIYALVGEYVPAEQIESYVPDYSEPTTKSRALVLRSLERWESARARYESFLDEIRKYLIEKNLGRAFVNRPDVCPSKILVESDLSTRQLPVEFHKPYQTDLLSIPGVLKVDSHFEGVEEIRKTCSSFAVGLAAFNRAEEFLAALQRSVDGR